MTPEALSALTQRAYRHLTPWSAAQFEQTLSGRFSLLTSSDHAFVLGQIIADEAEILALAADPDRQRTGEATRALTAFHTQAAARGAIRVFLEVAAANTPARAFYTRHGYAEVGLRPGYYPQPDGTRDDAVIMSRTLP
ncbi:GNAT family N-acetyltransferase [Antarctobacter sp.]|uniref:GNAT family N-acetyltransferase n=1 Tax=Antarctobacter sp. TaxID=1872577 RepID=UPI002B273E85|nr:GNAT family N-acetyltransferase [Antarctobacter sp.]